MEATVKIFGISLECTFEYEPEEKGSRERGTGLQLEPDSPEEIILLSVEVKGTNVLDLLDNTIVTQIEKKCLEQLKET